MARMWRRFLFLVWTGGEVQGGFLGWPLGDLGLGSGLGHLLGGRSCLLSCRSSPGRLSRLVTTVPTSHPVRTSSRPTSRPSSP